MVILRRISEEVFLTFASIRPYSVIEDDEQAQAMIDEYFPEGAEDMVLEESSEEEESYEDEREMVEEEEEEEEEAETVDPFTVYSYL